MEILLGHDHGSSYLLSKQCLRGLDNKGRPLAPLQVFGHWILIDFKRMKSCQHPILIDLLILYHLSVVFGVLSEF